jgi:glycine betaine/proline transport system ATP-binding protein
VQNGTPEDPDRPANDYVAQFVQDVDRRACSRHPPSWSRRRCDADPAGVRGALRTMRENQAGAVFATENRRLVGVVTDRAVIRAVKSGESDLRRMRRHHVPTVGPDDLLTDIVETAVEASVPLAVVDDQGRLRGVIPRITLLAALGNVPATTREMAVVQTPLEMVAEFTPLVDAATEGER